MNEMYLVQAHLEWKAAAQATNEACIALLDTDPITSSAKQWQSIKARIKFAKKKEAAAKKNFLKVAAQFADDLYNEPKETFNLEYKGGRNA